LFGQADLFSELLELQIILIFDGDDSLLVLLNNCFSFGCQSLFFGNKVRVFLDLGCDFAHHISLIELLFA